MTDPAWRRGVALLRKYGLSFDLQTPWWHLADAAELACDFPDTPIILNHTGLPADRSAASGNPDAPGRPWLDTIRIFGVERCMFASNFPVDSLCADFDTIFTGFKAIVGDLSHAEQLRLFRENAVRFYVWILWAG